MSLDFPLILKCSPTPLHPVAAWLIPGHDPADWIDELAKWKIPMRQFALYVLPQSISNRSPAGVLVRFDAVNHPPPAQAPSPHVLPYGLLAQRLYVPINALLDPPVSADEMRSMFLHDLQIMHPTIGLIGFAGREALSIAQLFHQPRIRMEKWDGAKASPVLSTRLLEVKFEIPPPIRNFLDSAREDIGSKRQESDPRHERPPTSTRGSDLAGRGRRSMERLASWLRQRTPNLPVKTGWLDALGAWATARRQAADERLDAARQTQLQRLVEMMQSDPDKGLQYAFPLRAGATRGVAPPSDRLTPRSIDFNLSRLFGASPVDPWQVPWQIHQQLLAQYRAAANRELALGRHRRAAFIFAELLGDFGSAANALMQGKHFREAAALYREPLRNLRAAAECLERGGLLTEAVAIFEEIKLWINAGDMYARLERDEDAQRCYLLAVEEHIARQDFLPAARLLENKLHNPDRALELLIQAWPRDDSAGLCLAESFELLGRLGRHADAAQRVQTVGRQDVPAQRVLPLAQSLSAVSRLYPDATVRAASADATRVVVGNRLPMAVGGEVASLVQTVARLDPNDRLLMRDAHRYARATPPSPKPYPLADSVRSASSPRLIRTFQLGEGKWTAALVLGSQFIAMGTGKQTSLVSGDLEKGPNRWGYVASQEMSMALLSTQKQPMHVVFFTPEGQALGNDPSERLAFATVAKTGWPGWLAPSGILGLCCDEHDTAFVLNDQDGLGISAFSMVSGNLLNRMPLDLALSDLPGHRAMAARNGCVFLAAGEKLIQSGPTQSTLDLPHPARHVALSPPFSRLRSVITMTDGALVVWPNGQRQTIGQGMFDPVATFLLNGTLLLISPEGGRAFQTGQGKVLHKGSFAAPKGKPIAVTPTGQDNQFAVFTADGNVHVFEARFG